jgi:glycosyltransferase involved in cell wall biosynthesis
MQADTSGPDLSIIVPTRQRPDRLEATLAALGPQAAAARAEVVVVDDASGDATAAVLDDLAGDFPAPLRSTSLIANSGPGVARNTGVSLARAPVVVFFGDDITPSAGTLERHRAFHRAHADERDAVLGRIVPASEADTPFARWAHEQGKQYAFGLLRADELVPAPVFYAANCSLKRSLFDRAGGFDERFVFGHEEHELGYRLRRTGMRLAYDPEALAEHHHPTDLDATLARMRVFGGSYRLLTEVVAEERPPRPPGIRHRAKAAALTVLTQFPGLGTEATWAFLCEEAHREGFWQPGRLPRHGSQVRIGARLARRAARAQGGASRLRDRRDA